ncbi:MAG: CARDB domain-containing protein [Thermoplasmatota archaeon]
MMTVAVILVPLMTAAWIAAVQPPGSLDAPSRDLSSIYWPMVGRGPDHHSAGAPAVRGILDPVVKWTRNTTSLGAVGARIDENIFFDDVPSHSLFGIVESNETHIRIREGETGTLVWELDARKIDGRTANTLHVSPALADTDSDGRVEVLVYVRDVNQFRMALFEPKITKNATGYHWSSQNYINERIWITIEGSTGIEQSSSPVLHDISGDNVEDVIIGSGNNLIAFWGNNGTLMWVLEIGPIGETLSTPALYLGAGALKRIVVNSLSPTLQTMRTTVVNFNGDHLTNLTVALGSPLPYAYPGLITMPVVGDVTGDGILDILVSYTSRSGAGRIIVYTYSLTTQATITGIQGYLESTPALGDIDGDGDKEVFLHSWYTTTLNNWIRMACYDLLDQGTITVSTLWTRDQLTTGIEPSLETSPLLCDLDEDSTLDVVHFANRRAYAVSSAGANLWNLSIPQLPPGQNWFQGLIGDLGRDDFTDIFVDGFLISQKVVDLSVKEPHGENIYLSDPDPVEGSPVTINCVVQNRGTAPASDVVVLFIDTPIQQPSMERMIGYSTIPQVVTTAEATITWVPEVAGNHSITIEVDPNSTILETNELNNGASINFEVGEAYGDLTVHGILLFRGDGKRTRTGENQVRLVEGDPSNITVQVENIGEKWIDGAALDIYVDGSPPHSGAENVEIGRVDVDEIVNISIVWTPEGIPDGEADRDFTISATIKTPPEVDELDLTNNFAFNTTNVKNRTPVGGFDLEGTVYDQGGEPEPDVRVKAEIARTALELEDTTNSNGLYSIYLPETEYLDGDVLDLYAHKDLNWAEGNLRIYSEDGTGIRDLDLTDIPTLSITLSVDGPTEFQVMPRTDYTFNFVVENSGNIPGNVTIDRVKEGNSTLSSGDFSISPNEFNLGPGQSITAALRFNVPPEEVPGTESILTISGTLTGDGTDISSIQYRFITGRSARVYYEFNSEKNVTLNANDNEPAVFRIYLLNKGNVDAEYNISTGSTLSEYASIDDPVGTLRPSVSKQVQVTLLIEDDVDRVIGTIDLRTSGVPKKVSWEIRIDREFPNLQADDVIRVGDEDMVLGDTISLLGTVRNTGKVFASDVVCTFYQGDTIIGTTQIKELGPEEEATLSPVSWSPDTIGVKEVRLVIDPDDLVREEDEEDNEATRTFSFYPDISISSATLEPESPEQGGEVRAKVVLKNLGNAPVKRGFDLIIRIEGAQGEELASKEYDMDLLTTSS